MNKFRSYKYINTNRAIWIAIAESRSTLLCFCYIQVYIHGCPQSFYFKFDREDNTLTIHQVIGAEPCSIAQSSVICPQCFQKPVSPVSVMDFDCFSKDSFNNFIGGFDLAIGLGMVR